jgi:exonuclease III
MGSESILVWNAWGLNDRTRCNMLHELVAVEHSSIMCIQETKLVVTYDYDMLQMIGSGYDYFCLSTVQTRGGILVALRRDTWSVSLYSVLSFLVSAKFLA